MFVYFFLCTVDSSQLLGFFYETLFSMVDFHGEKTTKHFDQCCSHDDKNTLCFGALGQITDKITRF